MLHAALCRLRRLIVGSHRPLVLTIAALIPFLAACSGDSPTQPEDPNSIEAQIRALFPTGASTQDAALAQIADIRQQIALSATAQARSKTLALVDFTLTSFREGKLVGGTSAAAGNAASRLVNSLYSLVGMSPPNLPDGTLSNDGAAKIVGPEGALIVTPSGAAGVQIPPGAISEQVLVTVTRLPAPPTPGTGPLPTTLKQYPPYYDFSTFPAVPQFGDSVRVGVCQVTDPSSPLYAPEVAHDRLRLAHAVGTSVEILERVGVSDFLRCTNVTASVSPSGGWRTALSVLAQRVIGRVTPVSLYAAHGGLGGKVRSFSPFGAVDPAVATVTVTLTSPTVEVGSSIQASAVLKDADGNVLTGRLITWTSSDNGLATVSLSGLVTGVAAGGPVTITATSDGQNGTATVTVLLATFNLASLATGTFHTCGLTSLGAGYCWGFNGSGRLGNGTTTSGLKPTPVAGGLTFTSLAAGGDHTCGLANGGAAYCWGDNNHGELGDGTTTIRLTPTAVAGGLTFTSLALGQDHTCGVTSGGPSYCWGRNFMGELGDGTIVERPTPTLVSGGLAFTVLSASFFHTCGLTSSGAAYCWGYNADGALGDGTNTNRLTPTPVVGGLTFTRLALGQDHTCGLASSGAAHCWGQNPDGQIGDGTTTERLTPTQVGGGLTFTVIRASGGVHTCGLTSGGAAYCWGNNDLGMLGDGTMTNRLTPAQVSGGLSFATVAGGGVHSCGLTSGGAAYCWGGNTEGELGDGTRTNRVTPTPVARP
jgi:hypothetical protein